MKKISVKQTKATVRGTPKLSDVSTVESGNLDLCLDGKVLVSVRHWGGDTSPLHRAAASIVYPKHSKRTNGLPVKNRSFGFTTRNVIRGDFCSAASLARERPECHAVLCDFAVDLERLYADTLPAVFERHRTESLTRIASQWKLGQNRTFTSGNANRNNPIHYHYDTGNFASVCSAMIVLRTPGATGGELLLPEFDLGLYLADGDVLFFDGQGILHGVAPIALATDEDYRISLVYYTLEQAWKCLSGDGELDRIKQEKTQREQAIVGRKGYRGGKPEFRKRKDLPR